MNRSAMSFTMETSGDDRTDSAAIPFNPIGLFLLYGTLVLISLALIYLYAVNVPQHDDWSLVLALTTPDGPSAQWLWNPEADHRMPLLKAFLWLCWRISPGSLRLALFLAFALLAISIGTLLTTLSDRKQVFFPVAAASIPLLLLHPMYESVFTWYTTTSAMLLVSGWCFLIAAALITHLHPVLRLIATLIAITLIEGSGTTGVVAIAPVLFLLIIHGMSPFNRSASVYSRTCALLAGLGLLYVIVYFLHFPWSGAQGMVQEPNWLRRIEVAGQFLTAPLGLAGRRAWPLSVLVPLGIYAAAFFHLWRLFRNTQRLGQSELILFGIAIGHILLAATIGVGRERQGALLDRYGFYSAPGLVAAIVLLEMYGRRSLVRVLAGIPAAVMLCLLGLSISDALAHGKERLAGAEALRSDILSGMRIEAIVAEHANWGINEKSLEEGLRSLRAAGIRPFDAMCCNTAPLNAEVLAIRPRLINARNEG